MGYVFNELIPPAILLDHPGVTKEEFVELLDQTHSGGWQYGKDEPWDIATSSFYDKYHGGLEGLARILNWRELQESMFRPNPKILSDFSKVRGDFEVFMGKGSFLWYQQEGKYFLDPETFNRISASFLTGWNQLCNRRDELGTTATGIGADDIDYSLGYTDLILTAEAIKNRAWKLLSYRGLDHAEAFLRDFPQSRARIERAIWDAHTSLPAKARGYTYSEFLRMRLTAGL